MSENKGSQKIALPERHNNPIVSHFSVTVTGKFLARNLSYGS